jgi:RNA polymerase sigma factor (sigma-70 family)
LQSDEFPQNEFWQRVWPHYNSLSAFTRSLIPDSADDLLQDTLLVALKNWPKLRNPKSFRSWLFRISINEAHRMRRQSFWNRFKAINEMTDENSQEYLIPDDYQQVDGILMRMHLKTALSKMNYKRKQVILLHYLAGFSLKDIALLTDESLSAIKTRISRARRELKVSLEGKVNLSEIMFQREEELDHEINKTIDGAVAFQKSR